MNGRTVGPQLCTGYSMIEQSRMSEHVLRPPYSMIDNIDVTTAVNDNRRAWETREASLRGGSAFFGGGGGGGGGGEGGGDGGSEEGNFAVASRRPRHSASSPSLIQLGHELGLEKFVRDDDPL